MSGRALLRVEKCALKQQLRLRDPASGSRNEAGKLEQQKKKETEQLKSAGSGAWAQIENPGPQNEDRCGKLNFTRTVDCRRRNRATRTANPVGARILGPARAEKPGPKPSKPGKNESSQQQIGAAGSVTGAPVWDRIGSRGNRSLAGSPWRLTNRKNNSE
jgi:hypothetical protein